MKATDHIPGSLLVASVFASDAPEQLALMNLQLKFLDATTPEFEHLSFMASSVRDRNLGSFRDELSPVVKKRTQWIDFDGSHIDGLKAIRKEFLYRQKYYHNFLILDSDAFPIKAGWMSQLLSKMDGSVFDGKGNFVCNRANPYEIAAVLRYENLEKRLHASILFMKNKALGYIDFQDAYVGKDLVGDTESDVQITPYQTEKRALAFPLIRSNKVNVHPLACGVYFDSFYHHGAGSRDLVVRGKHYWEKWEPTGQDYKAELMANPSGFISTLAGWNPDRYAKVE